jgi:large subunit ribosomal protein L13
MKTYSVKPTDITRKWYVIDASEAVLGRLSTEIATLLTGKGKPMFSHHIDCGDYVIVTNAKSLKTTGNKLASKIYYSHSFYPGGLKSATLQEKFDKDPTSIIEHSVKGMLPVNKLRKARMARLKIYSDDAHGHDAQKPEKYSIRSKK